MIAWSFGSLVCDSLLFRCQSSESRGGFSEFREILQAIAESIDAIQMKLWRFSKRTRGACRVKPLESLTWLLEPACDSTKDPLENPGDC